MLGTTGTFTSCKDYDDDINNLQEQITANADAIKKLQDLVGDGKFVTGVTSDGNTITFTFSDNSTVPVTIETEQAQKVEVKGDELYIDDQPTGIKVAKEAEIETGLVKAENGTWWVLGEDGKYTDTGIPVSGLAVVGNEKDGWELTITDAEGNEQTVKVPSAASLITSITVKANSDFVINYANFAKPNSWKGKATLPDDKSVIFVSEKLDIRVNPVTAPATEVDYYLTNAKNVNLSNVVLKAESTDIGDDLTIGDAQTRAAYSGNGLYTLAMERAILTPDAGKAFVKELKKVGYTTSGNRNDAVAYAVDANKSARSAYDVAVKYLQASALTSIQIKNVKDTENSSTKNFTAKVGSTYTITEGTDQNDKMVDMYFEISKTAQETFGVEYDDLNRTFKVTKNPDVATPANSFDLKVYTLDITGATKTFTYTITLNTEVTSDVTYDAVIVDLAEKFATATSNNEVISLDKMVEALGSNWAQWANNVDLTTTTAKLYAKADLSDTPIDVNASNGKLTYDLVQKDATKAATSADDLASVKLTIKKGVTPDIKLDTQYYLQVTFNNASSSKLNSIIVPITFTAPSVADQMSIKPGYVDAETGSIFAYYDDATNANKNLSFFKYFDKYIADAKYALDTDKEKNTIYQDGTTKYSSDDLAIFENINGVKTIRLKYGSNKSLVLKDGTNREFGYGKQLIVNVTKAEYEGWSYTTDSKKGAYSLTITILSPIFEGKIAATTGTSINVIANNEEGFPITADMISLTDYANNKYNVVPDKEGAGLTNSANNSVDAWASAQVKNVYVTKDANNTYISNITLQAVEKDGDKVTKEGAIVVFGDVTATDSVETEMTVHVADAWGYVTSQKVDVTIVKNK